MPSQPFSEILPAILMSRHVIWQRLDPHRVLWRVEVLACEQPGLPSQRDARTGVSLTSRRAFGWSGRTEQCHDAVFGCEAARSLDCIPACLPDGFCPGACHLVVRCCCQFACHAETGCCWPLEVGYANVCVWFCLLYTSDAADD